MEKVRWIYGESPTQVFYTADAGPDKICVFRVRWFKKWMAVVNNRLLLDPA